jgi:hypothetical protein
MLLSAHRESAATIVLYVSKPLNNQGKHGSNLEETATLRLSHVKSDVLALSIFMRVAIVARVHFGQRSFFPAKSFYLLR